MKFTWKLQMRLEELGKFLENWKEQMLENQQKTPWKSKIDAPKNAGSSLVSQLYMQFIPKKRNLYFKDESAILTHSHFKKEMSPQTDFFSHWRNMQLTHQHLVHWENHRLWQNVHVCYLYVGFLIWWIPKTMVFNAEKM